MSRDKDILVVADEGESDGKACWHGRIGTTCSDPVAGGFGGALCTDGRQSVLPVRMVPVCQQCTACAGQGHPSAEQVTDGTPCGGGDRGLWEHAAAQQHGHCMGIIRLVFGCTAVHGLHRQGMAEHERHPVLGTQIGQPVLRKQACGSQDDLLAGGRNGLEQRLWGSGHVAVHQCFPGLIEEAHVHGAGVEIDAAVKRVLGGGESP